MRIRDIVQQTLPESKNEELDRRRFLRGLGATALAGAGVGTAHAQVSSSPKDDKIVATLSIESETKTLDLTSKNFKDVKEARDWLERFLEERGIKNWNGVIERGVKGSGRYQRARTQNISANLGSFGRNESIDEALKDRSLQSLQKAKQDLEKNRSADLDSWEKDFRQNYAPKFAHLRKPEKEIPNISSIGLEKPEPKKKDPEPPVFQGTSQELTSNAKFILNVVEKLKNLDNLKEKANNLGILSKTLKSEVDMEYWIDDAKEKNDFSFLDQKVDDSIEKIQERIRVHRLAYKPKRVK